MAALPPLTWLTGLAAVAELLINRVLIKLGHESWSPQALVRLDRAGGFALNLSVVAGLVVLGFCLASFASRRSQLPLSARTGIAGFGWVLIPIVTLMTVLPLALTRRELVMVVAGLAHAIILLLVLAGLSWRSKPSRIAALILILVAYLSGLASMSIRLIGGRSWWEHTERLANAFQWSGELAYLTVPVVVGFSLAIPFGSRRGKVAIFSSTVAAALIAIGIAFWQRAAGEALPTMIYGALRLDLLPDAYVTLYAIPLGIGWAVTTAAVLAKDPIRRQLGASLLLLLSVGYAPQTPGALVLTVVGVALMARSAIASSDRPLVGS